MSQEKIDAYKKEKAGRKERIAKQKVHMKIAKICGGVVLLAALCALAVSIYLNRSSADSAGNTDTTLSPDTIQESADTTQSTEDTEAIAETEDISDTEAATETTADTDNNTSSDAASAN